MSTTFLQPARAAAMAAEWPAAPLPTTSTSHTSYTFRVLEGSV